MEDLIPQTPNISDVPTPSKAEGDEETGKQSQPKTSPSKAEGDEATIDQDIKDKL